MKYALFCFILIISMVSEAQHVQWRGINFSGHFEEKGLLKEWPEGGPEKILVIENLGRGWSSAILSNEKIYVTCKVDMLDVLKVYNLKGELIWEQPFGQAWDKSYSDTRSTPTVHNGNVYVVSGKGNLVCFNAESGDKKWEQNVDHKFRAKWDIWGVSESSLIVDDVVVSVPAGGVTSMVAFNKETGAVKWKTRSLGGSRMYVSPVLYEYKGIRQIIAYTSEQVFAVNPKSGEVDWTFNIRDRFLNLPGMNNKWPIFANSPIIKDNQIFLSQGWDAGAIMLEVERHGKSVKELWMNRDLDNQQYGCVEIDGYIYGSNMHNLRNGEWMCLNWETGRPRWKKSDLNKGLVVVAEGMLYIYDEDGTIALVKPDSNYFKIISSFKLEEGTGQHWASPFIADGKLLIRHGNSLVVFDIKAKKKI